MNCPRCFSPMLFGATACGCGYTQPKTPPRGEDKTVEERAIELSYFEALRAYWRVYWPSLILVLIGARALWSGTGFDAIVSFILWAMGLVLFVSRITARPYRGFSVALRQIPGGEIRQRMAMNERLAVFAFLWWKQLIPLEVASVVATALGRLGLTPLAAGLILHIGIVLLLGPILLKSMIIDPFETFQIFVSRKEA
jgi:hypothetical protein